MASILTTATVNNVVSITFESLPTIIVNGQTFFDSGEIVEPTNFLETTIFSVNIPAVTSETIVTASDITGEDSGDSSSSIQRIILTSTNYPTLVLSDRTSSVSSFAPITILRSTSQGSAKDSSDRTSSVLATSSPTVPIANSPSTTRSTPNNSIAPGAAAGIGVGSAAAGALIAALIVWFIMRKARKSPQIPNDDPGGSWLSSNTA